MFGVLRRKAAASGFCTASAFAKSLAAPRHAVSSNITKEKIICNARGICHLPKNFIVGLPGRGMTLRPTRGALPYYQLETATQIQRRPFCSNNDAIESAAKWNPMFTLDISSQVGSCMPLGMMRIGTLIHNIELRPGQGAKLVRAAGTSAKILTEPSSTASRYCEVKLPSGVKKLIDTRCRATIGTVSNPEHRTKKLRKAGQSRWLGIRPTVRGVAMNPVDHPHGGGEGKSKSSGSHGKVSRSPWGKPTKGGYKTGPLKRKK